MFARPETPHANSLDALRLVAAAFVLYSHQFALLGLPEPLFTPWNSFGDAGVAIFFFLSGCLVWTSWARDPNAKRFFQRRSLRIFPALWVLCLVSVFVLGPLLSVLPVGAYFGSIDTWRYLGTALLVSSKTLPGLFPGNAIPFVVNGSLWTMPVEFLCYVTVALFWFGVLYGHGGSVPKSPAVWVIGGVALLAYALLGPRSLERTVILVCAALLVHLARNMAVGARLTEPLGDLSYGLYIFAFPVQQIGVHLGRGLGWGVGTYLCISAVVTMALAYLSWHGVEKQALRFKPLSRGA